MAELELRPAAASELVTLYVGGVAFETTLGTLTSVSDSALARLYISAPTSDPPYHFDRNPDLFHAVLNALRRRAVPRKPDAVRADEWEDELRFWGLMPAPATPAHPAAPTTPAATHKTPGGTAATKPVEEVPDQALLVRGHGAEGPFRYRLPARPSNLAIDSLTRTIDASLLAGTMWCLLQQFIKDGTHGVINNEDRSWSMSLTYTALRRMHHLPRVIGSQYGGSEGIRTSWFSTHLFLRGVNIDGLAPVAPEIFDAAMRAVFKGFADQRLNEGMRYEVSTSGSGDGQVLHVRLANAF